MNQRQLPINQHQATLLPNIQNAPYRHLTPMGYMICHRLSYYICHYWYMNVYVCLLIMLTFLL